MASGKELPTIWSARNRATSRSRRAIPDALRATLRPGDVLLVEGNNHVSGVIKYLTQSTWSHAALYVGPIGERTTADGEPLVLVEAVLGQGVVGAPLSKYAALPHPHLPSDRADRGRLRPGLHLCGRAHRLRLRRQEHLRPAALSVAAAGAAALAPAHDVARLRASDPHHLFGPDRAGVRARALSDPAEDHAPDERAARRDILEIRHSSLYAPRDFDISPYFQLVKPTIENGFDYRRMAWAHLPHTHEFDAFGTGRRGHARGCRGRRPARLAQGLLKRQSGHTSARLRGGSRCSMLPSRR